jgi:hypothetical protein
MSHVEVVPGEVPEDSIPAGPSLLGIINEAVSQSPVVRAAVIGVLEGKGLIATYTLQIHNASIVRSKG